MIWLVLYIVGAYATFDHLASSGHEIPWWDYIVTPLLWPILVGLLLALGAYLYMDERVRRLLNARG